MRILAAGPNAIEVISHCGGTLCKVANGGGDLMVVATDLEQLAVGESRPGQTSASSLDTSARRAALTEMIREFDPDIVLGPSPDTRDEHGRATAELLFSATYAATVPNFPLTRRLRPTSHRTAQFAYDDPVNPAYQPQHYVDISALWPRKLSLLRACGTGVGDDPVAFAKELGRLRGQQVQVEFAEVFRQIQTWGRLRSQRLLPE